MVSRYSKKREGNSLWCLCTLPIIIFPFAVIFWLHRSFSNEDFLQNSGFHSDKLGSAVPTTNDLRTLKEQTLFFESLLNMTKVPNKKSAVLGLESRKQAHHDKAKTTTLQRTEVVSVHLAGGEDSLPRDAKSEDASVYDDRGEVIIVTPQTRTKQKYHDKLTFVPKEEKITGQDLLSAFFEQVVPDHMAGKLNVHTWQGICGPFVEQLRHSPLFPRFPSLRRFLEEFKSQQEGNDFGQRIFGFIHPEKQGLYEFAITSDDTSELWLSSDSNPKKSRLIAAVYSANGAAFTTPYNLKKYPIQVSREIELKPSKKYYIEALHKQSKGRSHIQVFWKEPGSKRFRIIQGSHLSLFVDDRELHDEGIIEEIDYESYAPIGIPSHAKRKLDHSVKKFLFSC
ncbi:uncharacterized protein [Montipora capricornis]|uniref:uncharacterized protein n=1 Tax=Montipora capricornis TaxID=246305 RepID=UPI0035F18628